MTGPPFLDNARSEDPDALEIRSQINLERGSFDLADWLTRVVSVGPGDRLLDVGCGTGQLLMRYGRPAMQSGCCIALDVSRRSLAELRKRASGLSGLSTICADMDELADDAHSELTGLTRIVSAYALYYSADPSRLLAGLKQRLHSKGRLVLVGPAPGNNSAWYALLRETGFRIPDQIRRVSEEFLDEVVMPFASRSFRSMRLEIAENDVHFDSPEEVEAYWRSNIYYDDSFDKALHARINARFASGGEFVNRKRIALVVMEDEGTK
ncbi:MAG: methyltransferase domain-containing protein [Myxococcota bacterium]